MKFNIFVLLTMSFISAQKSYNKEKITRVEYDKYANSSYSDRLASITQTKSESEFFIKNYFENTYNYLPDSVVELMKKNKTKTAYIGSNIISGTDAYFRFSEGKESISIHFDETGLILLTEYLPAVSKNGKYLAIYTIKSELNEEVRKNAFTVIKNNENFTQVFAIASRNWVPFGICWDYDNHVLIKVKPKKKAADKDYFEYYRYKIKRVQDLKKEE